MMECMNFVLSFIFLVLASAPTLGIFRFRRFHTDAVRFHNHARFLHNVIPMTLNIKLVDKANNSASHILETIQSGVPITEIKKPKYNLSETSDLGYYAITGENIWSGDADGKSDYDDNVDNDDSVSVIEAIKNWYSQGNQYPWKRDDFRNTPESILSYQDFAQMLWNTTTQVGCSWARDPSKVVIVCHYHPTALLGNYDYMSIYVPERVYSNDFAFPGFHLGVTVNKPDMELDYSWLTDTRKEAPNPRMSNDEEPSNSPQSDN